MTARLRNHHVLLLGLGCAALAMAACASPDVAHAVADTKETTHASSVIVEMKDASGNSLGTCSGTLTSSKTVLTAGHCIAGVKAWSVTSGSKTVKGSVGSTSWTTFGSDLSHPEHSDVGMIALDSEISLSSYPSIAASAAADGSKGLQFYRASASATTLSSTAVTIQSGASKGFRLNYLVSSNATFVDPGAAVLDANNNIIGVVSGKGKASGMLHVARVENYRTWAKAAVTCTSSLATRDWGSGNTDTGGAGYGGTPSTVTNTGGWGDTTGGGWGSSSGGYGGGNGSGNGNTGLDGGSTVPGYNGGTTTSGGTTSGGTTSGGATSSGGTDTTKTTVNPGDGSNTCPGAPVCEGSDCGAGGSGLNGGTGSASPAGSGSSSNSTGSLTTTNNPDGSTTTTTTNPNGTTTTTTVTPGTSGSGSSSVSQTKNTDGSTTTTVTEPNGTTSTTTTDANGNPVATPATPATGTGEGCSGSKDNNDTCPASPDSATCAGATCGACASGSICADVNIDYGACGAGACGTASTTPAIK